MLAECKGLQAATETTRGGRLIQSQLRLFNTNIDPAHESVDRAFTANLGFGTVPARVLFHFSLLNKSRREGQTSQ